MAITTNQYDICVIGAGAAGLYLTAALAKRRKLRVCLIEAGPKRFRDRRETVQVTSLRKLHHGVNEARVTAFGGATNTWGGGLVRASPYDFRMLSDQNDTAWPIPYSEIEPHYGSVERVFGIPEMPWASAPIVADHEDWRAVLRDVPILPFRSKNFGRFFGGELAAAGNVDLVCDAGEWSWRLRADTGEPELVLRAGGRGQSCVRARHFVIAAGLVGSVRCIRNLLEQVAPAVAARCGTCFHDHLSFPIARLRPASHWKFSERHSYRFRSGLMWSKHFDLESVGRTDPGAYLHFTADMSASPPLRLLRNLLYSVQNGKYPPFKDCMSDLREFALAAPRIGVMRYFGKRVLLDRHTGIFATIDIEQIPGPTNTLQFGGEAGPIAVEWDVTTADARMAIEHVRRSKLLLAALLEKDDISAEWLLPENWEDPSVMGGHLQTVATDTFHAAGGLRFGGDVSAVVDRDLNLRAIPRVSVLSTAVFPRVGTSNPTLTLLALADRLEHRLA
jgi:hypothetical protein